MFSSCRTWFPGSGAAAKAALAGVKKTAELVGRETS
jgi:hypothetical protein